MKRIVWITADYFSETDLNFDVLANISIEYEIFWIVLEGRTPYFEHSAYDKVMKLPNLHLVFLKNQYRTRDPRSLLFYYSVLKKIKKLKPDLLYYNVAPNPASALVSLFFDKEKTIFTAHDGKAQNDSAAFGRMRTFAYNVTFHHAKNINMFSKAQADLMRQTYGEKNIHIMNLPLKNFGKSKKTKPVDMVRFLSFGHIIYQKNIDLLIEAGNLMYERGLRGFKISINGTCEDWKFYEGKIKYKDIFECNPNFISNDELLDLFETSHYAVFPYRRVSQSGVLKVAFNYKLPVVVSNIGSFKEEVKEGENGFFFNVGSADSLADVLEKLLKTHQQEYALRCEKMDAFIKNHYSNEKSAESYINFFKQIING